MKRLPSITNFQTLEILNKIQFFNVFNQTEKDILTGFHSHFFLINKGESVIKQGGNDKSFYILLTGRVVVRRDESKKPLATLSPGDFFGEASFLTERPRTTSVISLENCIVFEIDKATLNHLDISIREKLKDNIIKVLLNRLDQLNKVISTLRQGAI